MDKRYIAGWQLSRSYLNGKKEVIMWTLGSNRTGKTYRAEKACKLTLASMLYGVESFHSCHYRVSAVGNCIESSTFARRQSASEESSLAWQQVGLNLGVWPNSGVMSRVRVEGLNSWVEFEVQDLNSRGEGPNLPLDIRTQFCRLRWVKTRIEWSDQKKRKIERR